MAVNWAEKLQNHFAAGSKDEVQQLRTLPRAALLYDEETFSPFDADGDGKLDQDELAHFMRRPLANVEIVVNADREGSLPEPTVSHLDAGVGHLDDPTGHPTLVAGRERIELTAGSFNSARGEYQNVRNRFMRADQDKNDYLDKNEIQRFGLEGIETLDTDGDGKLYLQEITDFLDSAAEMAAHRLLVSVIDHGHGLFEALDADHDDELSHRELMQLAQSAKLWDLNGDGQLTLEEVPHLYSMQVSQQPVQLPFNNGFFRQNFGRGRMANGRAFKAAPAWFSSMDRNNDGDLSVQEFLGSPAQFRQFDADGDQLIDSQEANAQITPAVTATAAAAVPPPVTPPPAGDAAEGEEPISLP
jgi:Ca2+-binding EF-hand superfamily protein